jgi:hypothetical protein
VQVVEKIDEVDPKSVQWRVWRRTLIGTQEHIDALFPKSRNPRKESPSAVIHSHVVIQDPREGALIPGHKLAQVPLQHSPSLGNAYLPVGPGPVAGAKGTIGPVTALPIHVHHGDPQTRLSRIVNDGVELTRRAAVV